MERIINNLNRLGMTMLFLIFTMPMWAGGHIKLSDFIEDSPTITFPIENDSISINLTKGRVSYDPNYDDIIISEGSVIQISSKIKDEITYISINSDDFSCDTGYMETWDMGYDLWEGSASTVNFECSHETYINDIWYFFSSDEKRAYALKEWKYYGLESHNHQYTTLVFYYDQFWELRCYSNEFYRDEPYYEKGPLIYYIDDDEYPGWYNEDIEAFEFDRSFSKYLPKCTSHWFSGQCAYIFSLDNLNTSMTTDMSYMFEDYRWADIYIIHYGDEEDIDDRIYIDSIHYGDEEDIDDRIYTDSDGGRSHIDIYHDYNSEFFSSILTTLNFSSVKNRFISRMQ